VRDLARVAYGDLSDNPFQQLSVREMQIMLMVLGCKSPSAIAQVLHLSAKTVNSYRYRLFEKLGVKSDVELAIMAIQHEVVDLGAQKGDRPRTTDTPPDRKGPVASGTGADLTGYDSQHSTADRGTS
jgi:DNA-binding CsgD family transcriptional regulator